MTDSQVHSEVERIRRTAAEHDAHVNRVLLALLVVAVVVAVATWFLLKPVDRDLGLSVALGFSVFCIGGIVGRIFMPIPRAECPQCGCDWRAESDNNTQTWLSWRCCPGCGLKLTGENDPQNGS